MEKTYRVRLYGKKGCEKCKILKDRLDTLLSKDEWQEFDSTYFDIETVDGLVSFVNTECLNPQRIPSFIIEKLTSENGQYALLENAGAFDSSVRQRVWRYVGLETDYSEKGRGLIKPQAIVDALNQAKDQ